MLYFLFETSSLSINALNTLCALIDKLQMRYPKSSNCYISGNYSDDLLETVELSGWNVILGEPTFPHPKTIQIFRKSPHDTLSSSSDTVYLCSESGSLFVLASTT